jgi:hypothetical protein
MKSAKAKHHSFGKDEPGKVPGGVLLFEVVSFIISLMKLHIEIFPLFDDKVCPPIFVTPLMML